MSTLPSSTPIDPARTSEPARHDSRGLRVMRNIDLIVLAVTLPIFLVAGWPILGWATGAGAWIGQRLLRDFMASRARRSTDVREQVGYLAGSMIARGWLVSLVILGVGLATDQDVGLSAAILFVLTFTSYLTMAMITGPFDGEEAV
jgi:hypothetical protein